MSEFGFMDDVDVRRLSGASDNSRGSDQIEADEDDFFANGRQRERGSSTDSTGTIVRRLSSSFIGSDDGGGDDVGGVGPQNGRNSRDTLVRRHSSSSFDSDDGGGNVVGGVGPQNGLIEEEKEEDEVPAQVPAQVPGAQMAPARPQIQLPVLAQPQFSREAPGRNFDPAQWRTGRTDSVLGKYWKTFGERKRAVGGGVSGFFSSLFGRGMARANRQAEKRAFLQAPILAARAWRQRRREEGAENVPARSALRNRLVGPAIRNLSTFPREPGVQYDEQAASQAHRGFMAARREQHDAREDGGGGGVLFGDVGSFMGVDRSRAAEGRMKQAYSGYDRSVGNNNIFENMRENPADGKYMALTLANRRAGADIFHTDRRQRRSPQRVRFQDGADDAVGKPVNDDAAGSHDKPMPSSVRFFPAPIGKETLTRDAKQQFRREQHSPAFQALSPDEQNNRRRAFAKESKSAIDTYADSLGASGHASEIPDEQAMDNAQYAWPLRAQLLRMRSDDRFIVNGRHDVAAMNLEQQALRAGTDPLDSDEFRDHSLRSHIGSEVDRDLNDKARSDAVHRQRRSTLTAPLGNDVSNQAAQTLVNLGVPLNPDLDLAAQVPQLPRDFFDLSLKEGYDQAAAGNQGGPGGAGLIEEEKEA